ncbi:hypothetical protein Q1695_008539 [Nippostrongylus brasiliensis]|nr:hypothetical protein Q1695_008533 [Nippostrongylus brasiliensis]WKX88970.1 hypothetical protein Q1695_008539 [Nippostrongylus brasiliensis]
MLLVKYIYQAAEARKETPKKLHAVFMSATLRMWKGEGYEERCDCKSNYPILDHELSGRDEHEARNNAEKLCLSRAQEVQSVLYLVPTAEGALGAKAIATRLKGKLPCAVIALTRSTYDNAMRELKENEGETKVIVATDIVEVGANLDIDVVIDLGIKRTYRCKDAHVRMETVRINRASWTQRVGRARPNSTICGGVKCVGI